MCPECGKQLSIGEWPLCPHGRVHITLPAVHAKQRAVVWENPLTGQVRYPGRNDVKMPERYAQQGYMRKEFETARSLTAFEKQRGVANESLHCNSGNSLDSDVQSSPADTASLMPVTPGGSDSLTAHGVTLNLRSRNG